MIVTNTLLDAALDYAARGWQVVPIKPGEKRPSINQWTEKATDDADLLAAWWRQHPTHGVGIATGPRSGIWVLDVDGDTGKDTLKRLEAEHGELPHTYTVATGSGGLHYYWRWVPGLDVRNDASKRLGPCLDVRGDGGQVVAPPTTHPNGTPYRWTHGDEPVDAPGWLLDLLRPVDDLRDRTDDGVAERVRERPLDRTDGTARPGDRFNDTTTWEQLLEADGWTLHHTDRSGEVHWTRPGKDRREGSSATTGYQGADVLHVFSSGVAGLDPEENYSRFAYYTATRHAGDYGAAARALGQLHERDELARWLAGAQVARPIVDVTPDDPTTPTVELAQWFVHWPEFWEHTDTDAEWLVEPIIAAGRQHAIHAGAKTGKSLLLLEMCAALATGRKILERPTSEPVDVLYVDYEMSPADLMDRLRTFGYGPDDDLTHLHYALLPSIAPLDSYEGGMVILQAAIACKAQFVVIDTTARAVAGPENEADTFRAFYRYTGLALKAAGIALARADHSGKNKDKGQRGSSAKNDDVDLVWEMSRMDDGVFRMKATHRRMSWVPEQVDLQLTEGDDGVERFSLAHGHKYAPGTAELAARLEVAGVPVEAGERLARKMLKEAGLEQGKAERLREAIKYRRSDEYVVQRWLAEA